VIGGGCGGCCAMAVTASVVKASVVNEDETIFQFDMCIAFRRDRRPLPSLSDARAIRATGLCLRLRRFARRSHDAATRTLRLSRMCCAIGLLLVFLDHGSGPDARLIGIVAKLAARPSLSQEIPALIELNLNFLQPGLRAVVKIAAAVQMLLFVHQRFNLPQHARVAFRV